MLDVFKARIKALTKAKGVNLSQKRIDAFADRLHRKNLEVTEEAAHDTLIDALDELVVFADVAKTDDRLRNLESNPKPDAAKPADEEENSDDDEETKKGIESPGKKERVPKWAKSLFQMVESLNSDKKKVSIQARLKESLKDIPATFYEEWNLPSSDDEIEAFESKVRTKWETFSKVHPVQPASGQKGHQPSRSAGAAPEKVDDKELDAILDKI